jgi:dTDP-4-dehydrorhamnose reductase
VYKKEVEIVQNDNVKIDRSLNHTKFTEATGYQAPDWDQLIKSMKAFNEGSHN